MKTLTYWLAKRIDDGSIYSIREKTRRACKETLVREWGTEWPEHYEKPVKVTVQYKDAFDLVRQALNEGGIEPP